MTFTYCLYSLSFYLQYHQGLSYLCFVVPCFIQERLKSKCSFSTPCSLQLLSSRSSWLWWPSVTLQSLSMQMEKSPTRLHLQVSHTCMNKALGSLWITQWAETGITPVRLSSNSINYCNNHYRWSNTQVICFKYFGGQPSVHDDSAPPAVTFRWHTSKLLLQALDGSVWTWFPSAILSSIHLLLFFGEKLNFPSSDPLCLSKWNTSQQPAGSSIS